MASTQHQDRQTRRGEAGTHPVVAFFRKDVVKDFVFVVVAFLFLNSFVIASFEVPTGSMENEIMTGDFLFVNKFIFGGSTPRTIPLVNIRVPWFRVPGFRKVDRGDVIVFEFPGNRDEIRSDFQFYLKRCVAMSGDTIRIARRVLYVNGKPAPIPRNIKFDNYSEKVAGRIEEGIFPKGSGYNEDNWGPEIVPTKGDVIDINASNFERWKTFIGREGHVAVLRRDGTVMIDGVPTTSYSVKRNYYFGMGDHRDNSLDSRFWGYIPEENIVGTPMIVYWSWDPKIELFNIFSKLSSIRLGRVGTIIK